MSLISDEFGVGVAMSEADVIGLNTDTWKLVSIGDNQEYRMEAICRSIGDTLAIPLPRTLNWDALYDDLRNLNWMDWISLDMLFTDGCRVFDLDSIDQVIFIKLLSGVALHWKKRGRKLRIVLVGNQKLARLVQMIVVPWNIIE